MKLRQVLYCILAWPMFAHSQQATYSDSIQLFIANYIAKHEVVTGDDRKFLQFFAADESFRVIARFEKSTNSEWFTMNTSGGMKPQYRVYGLLSFFIHDSTCQLRVYQSRSLMDVKAYADYLFVPYTDLTSGFDTYGGGRYIDLAMADLASGKCVLDFNKAYNPYCAYVTGYDCPIPPKENELKVTIHAGEMRYLKH